MQRNHECMDCRNTWTADIQFSEHSHNLSGEKTAFCPKCNGRNVLSSAAFEPEPLTQGTHTMTTTKQAEIAKQFAEAFTTDTRNDGTTFYKLRDGSPQWMTDAIHAAHGDILPMDWIYEHCSRMVDNLTEYEPDQWDDSISEWCDGLVDVYNIDRAKWLALHLDFAGFVDDAVEEFGHSDQGVIGDIGMGQYKLLEQIAYAMLNAVNEQAEESSDDEE